MSESAESSLREDTVIFLTLLFVYGLRSRSAEKSQSVRATSGQGAGSEAARWGGVSAAAWVFIADMFNGFRQPGLVFMSISRREDPGQ